MSRVEGTPEVQQEIRGRLTALEQDETVIIPFAVESGSRAWGFPSADSDYDVRFLYVRRPEWYLSIDLETRPDVIERPIHDMIDLSGWDLRKGLNLFRKSNPPLFEWLNSPIIYKENYALANRLRSLVPHFYSPVACFYHYLHMARGNFRDYLRGEMVWRKKYFYVLRPLLALRWIERDLGVVPMEFERLVEQTADDRDLKREIYDLLALKKTSGELDRGFRIEVISRFIEAELARHDEKRPEPLPSRTPIEELNLLFQEVLREVWGQL